MKRIALVLAVAVVVCLAVQTPSFAQPGGRGQGRGGQGRGGFGGFGGGGGGGIAMLVMNEAVQKDIELEDFQLEGIQEAMEDLERPQLDFRGLRDLDEDERNEKMTEFREEMEKFTKKQEERLLEFSPMSKPNESIKSKSSWPACELCRSLESKKPST